MPNWVKKLLHFLSFGALFVPLGMNEDKIVSTNKATEDNIKEKGSVNLQPTPTLSIDFNHVFSDTENKEFARYIVNNTRNQHEVGIHPDGKTNMILTATATNEVIINEFTKKNTLKSILHLFHPEFDEAQTRQYLDNFPILVGQDIDYYLESIRKGSYGTTVMSVNRDGQVHFDSLSLRKSLVSPSTTYDPEYLQDLLIEEFLQAHQYESVIATLFNTRYLDSVAKIGSPESLTKEISVGNLRAFLELFPQQKLLNENNLGRNSYNFYVGNKLFEGPSSSKITIDAAYNTLVDFIVSDLGIDVKSVDFLKPELIQHINDTFREKYLYYYAQLGIPETQVQIWNLVGMKRTNNSTPTNSLDMPNRINLPLASHLAGQP